MFFDKQAVLDHISEQVGPDQAAQAAQMLPDQVDHEQHASLLQQFGIDPQTMVSQLASQFGGQMGGYGQQGQGSRGDQGQRDYGDQGRRGYGDQGQGYDDEDAGRGSSEDRGEGG